MIPILLQLLVNKLKRNVLSLRIPYRRKAVWLLNDATIKALRKSKTTTATTSGSRLSRPGHRIPS